jgi:hypothetical protein
MTELSAPYHYMLGYIVEPVQFIGIPSTLEINGVTYQSKVEYHCSLIAVKSIIPLVVAREGLAHDAAEALVMEVASKIVNEIRPSITNIGPELRLADQPDRDRHTLVVMVNVPGIEPVFSRLNQELRLQIPTQVTHITLAGVYGLPIGLPSADDLAKYTRLLTPDEQKQLQTQLDLNKIFGATTK